MALILHIESSTEVCSVALANDGKLVCIKEEINGSRHSELLTVFIESVLNEAGIAPVEIDAVAVSMGPGSYTGLRIGVSVAKGLCYSTGKPLISVGTLEAMADYTATHHAEFGLDETDELLYCPMIDARRMEVYCGVFDSFGKVIEPVIARIITPGSFDHLFEKFRVCFAGNGSAKCKAGLIHPNALFNGPERASARFLFKIALDKYNNNRFEDVAYFEPFYLKDFIATVPKNKVF